MSRQSDFYGAVYNKAIELGANDVQARLAAAQASEETGYGASMVGGNLFGIKAGSDYVGPSVTASTEEEYSGNTVRENANFRAYDSITDSVKDYLSMVQTNFPDAWNAPTFSEAVKGLNTGVYGKYATRAAYGSHLKAIDNKLGALQFAQEPNNVPIPYSPSAFADLAGLPNDVIPVADPNFAPIDQEFAFAQDPANVPTPASPDDASLTAAIDPGSRVSTDWGLNRDVAPVPVPTVNSWAPVADAKPVQTPFSGLLNAPSNQRETIPTINNFADLAAAGPMGGDFAAPADRFAGEDQTAAQPFDRYVQTTSIPTEVDPNSYQPGTAPMVNTSAVPANRVQSISITPSTAGLLNAPAANQPITQADVDRALFNATGAGAMDPGFTEGLMSAQNPVVPSAVETTSFTPNSETTTDIASSRFSTPAKTSRIGQAEPIDAARMPGLVDPATNTTGFLNQPAAPAEIAGFLDATTAQRGPPTGIYSAEAQAQQGHVYNESLKAEAARQAAMVAQNPALATPNFAQAVNPSVPALSVPSVQAGLLGQPTATVPSQVATSQATPQQQAAGYQQMASAATEAGLLNFSGGNLYDVDLSGKVVPTAPYTPTNTLDDVVAAPALETVQVADQPNVAATVEGPATIDALDQQQETQTIAKAPTTVARTTPAVTRTQPSFVDKMKNAVNPGTALGALVGGGLLGIPGAAIGGFLGNTAYQNTGFLNQPGMTINPIGGGSEAVYSVWGGSQPPGTQATASDGQTVTSMPGGSVAITNKTGQTTVFDKSGKASSYFGSGLGQDEDTEASTSSGGFFGGLFN